MIRNENNYIYQVTFKAGKIVRKLLGVKCPHCRYFAAAENDREEWAIDAFEHITYCNPAHQRAMAGERY